MTACPDCPRFTNGHGICCLEKRDLELEKIELRDRGSVPGPRGYNPKKTMKRRKANKAARKARKRRKANKAARKARRR